MTTTSNLRRFGRYPISCPGIPTVEDSRAEGYGCGLTWDKPYLPTGPHIIRATPGDRGATDWLAFCAATSENRSAWFDGFRAGRSAARAST